MQTDNSREVFDIVDENGNVTGTATRSECHGNPSLLHKVVHVIIINDLSEILLQKRSAMKKIQPGKWDTSVGGHIDSGESLENASVREVNEETGIDILFSDLVFCYKYIMNNDIESELVYTYKLIHNGPFKKQDSEISDLRFWKINDITVNIKSDIFSPNFVDEFSRFIKWEENSGNNIGG